VLDLTRFFSCSPDLGFITDARGAILGATRGAERSLGYTEGELRGLDLAFLDEGGDLRRFFESAPSRSRMNLAFHLRSRSGAVLAVSALATLLRDEDGLPQGWFFAGQDLRGAVAESRESKSILDALVNSIDAAVWSFDRNGTVLTWGRPCEAAFGIPRAQAEGRLSVVRLFPTPSEYQRVLDAADREGRFSGEVALIDADGVARPNHVSVTPLIADGLSLGYTSVSFDITTRKRVEELQRSLFEQAGEAIVLVDLSARSVIDVNDRACEIYGYTKKEFEKVNVASLRENPEVSVEEVDRRLWETGRYESSRETGRRKDGSTFPCSLNIRTFTVGGKVYTVAVVLDLTQQRRAEEFFRVLFEKASDAVYLVEHGTMQVVEANEAVCRLLGYTREEFLKLKVPDLIPPELRHRIPGVRQIVEQETGYLRDRRMLLRKDGGSVAVDNTISRLDFGGRPYYLASCRDLTQQEQSAQELSEAKAFLEHLQENASDGIALLDEKGTYLSVNRRLLEILGARREDVIGKTYQSRADPAKLAEYRGFWERQLKGEVVSLRTAIDRPDGVTVPLEISSAAVRRGSRTFIFAIIRDVTDQVKSEERLRLEHEDLERRVAERTSELQKSEERFRAAFTQGGIGMALVGTDGRFLQVNRALCGMLGYGESELLETTFQALTHPEDRDRSLDHARRVLQEGAYSERFEKRYLHRDGRTVWTDLSTTLVRGAAGENLYFITSVQDITHRKEAQEHLRQSEARFRAITEATPVPVTITRPDGDILYVNDAAARLFGVDREAALGRRANEFYADPDDRMKQILLRDGMLTGFELRLRREDGNAFWTVVNLRVVAFEGAPAIFSSFVDIDARKRAEEALRESEGRYRALVEHTGVGVWHTTIDGRSVFANPAMLSILGVRDNSELDHRTVRDFFSAGMIRRMSEEFQKGALAGGFSTEGEILRPDRTRRQVVIFAAPMPSPDGVPHSFIGSIIDITERKRAEIELRESEERFRAITEGVPVAVVIARASDGTLLYANEQAAESLSIPPETITGRSILEFLARPEERSQMMERLQREGSAPGLEIQFRRSDGALFWGAASLRLASFRGEPVTLGVFSDITARKESEVLLKKAHEELEQRVLERTAELARANELLQEEIAERKRAEDALRLIVEGTAAVTGGSFFRSLARHLASALDVRFASVVRNLEHKPGFAETIAFWDGATFAEPVEYALEGTPCEDVLTGEACSYAHDVQRLFPQDRMLVDLGTECYLGVPMMDSSGKVVGLISVMDVQPARDEDRKLSMLKIFAARAGAELERQQGEEALRQSEERWRSLVQNAPDYILTVDRECRLRSLNRALEGLDMEKVIGASIFDFVPPESRPVVRTALDQVLKDGSPSSYETRAIGPNGTIAWYSTRVGPVVVRGEVVGATLIATDVTARRRAEGLQGVQHEVTQILAEEASLEEALARLVKGVCELLDWHVGLIWVAAPGQLRLERSWNASAPGCAEFVEACRGRSPRMGSGAAGRAWKDRSARWIMDFQRSEEAALRTAAERAGLHCSIALPIVDGDAVFGVLEFFAAEPREPDEALVRTINTVGSQITQFIERKRAEEDLRFQKSLLESQSEAAIDGILVVSRDGVMTSFNRRFTQMWDIPDDILHARTDERALQFVIEKLQNPGEFLEKVRYLYGHPSEESRDEILLKDGRTFDRYSAPVKGGKGAHYGRVWYFRDVTGRKQTEENLRRAAEETRRAYEDLKEAQAQLIRSEKLASIGMLVSGVAHEINNPLNVMYGNLQLLAEAGDLLLPLAREGARTRKVRGVASRVSRFRGMIRDALKAARHARGIVQDFRNFARDTRTAEMVDLNECLEEAVTLIQRELRPGIRVVRKLGRIPQVRCLRGQMSQVFLNLLKNAEESIEKAGTVTLRTQKKDGWVVAEVVDTGRGMPEEIRRKLFEPFFTTKPVGKGMGLGLSISAMIVQNHNGRITVRSRPGRGSVFRVELPLTS